MITDLAPTDLVVRAERTVVISAVVPRTRAQLDVEAAAAGYATTSAAATPNSSSTTSSTPLPQANP